MRIVCRVVHNSMKCSFYCHILIMEEGSVSTNIDVVVVFMAERCFDKPTYALL